MILVLFSEKVQLQIVLVPGDDGIENDKQEIIYEKNPHLFSFSFSLFS